VELPDTKYAVRADGRSVAYQVFGSGPTDLVFCWGFVSHLDLAWTNPDLARCYERLASFARVIVFDKLGTGLSDQAMTVPTLEERGEDILAVMDAAGSARAVVLGESEAGPSTILFAASHPERVSKIILYGSIAKARLSAEEGLRWGLDPAVLDRKMAQFADVVDRWGQGASIDLLAPSLSHSALARKSIAMLERASLSPSMARALIDSYSSIDVSGVLGSVTVPALVLHRTRDWIPVESSRMIAGGLVGARLVELGGEDHVFFNGDVNPFLDEVQRFVTGATTAERSDRVLATVLFTDIVGSTERATALGDTEWRQLLARHDDLVISHVSEVGGRVVKSLGDGALALFDGPARAVRCAVALTDALARIGVPIRAGIHTGECELIGHDVGGLAVHVGARVSSLAGPGEVLVSRTVKDLVIGSNLRFESRGSHMLKGVPEEWQLYAVVAEDAPPPLAPPGEQLRSADKLAVRLARRAPRVLRTISRVTGPKRPSPSAARR
jgi:class 3 adenylate cyclase